MKKAIALFTIITSLSAMACIPEAQIMVHVKDVMQTGSTCSATIEITGNDMWNPSYACPLEYDVASSAVINNVSCDLVTGDRLSGILSQNEDNTFDLY